MFLRKLRTAYLTDGLPNYQLVYKKQTLRVHLDLLTNNTDTTNKITFKK